MRLGRYAQAVFDPRQREPASLAILAMCLLLISWAWFWLLGAVLTNGEPLPLDLAVQAAMFDLRNPLADRLFAALAALSDAQVLLPPCMLALGYLCWRRRWMAAAHWLAALAFGMALTAFLDAVIEVPRLAMAPKGFGFPAMPITMATIALGFFAVLIARELPGRRRVWPYLLGGVIVSVIGFAKLYFGAHWLSDVVGGMLFGVAWLLLLGIAYRRRVTRSFWMRPLAALFYGAFVLAALWHAPRAIPEQIARHAPPASRFRAAPRASTASAMTVVRAMRAGLSSRQLRRVPAHRVRVPPVPVLRAQGLRARRPASSRATADRDPRVRAPRTAPGPAQRVPARRVRRRPARNQVMLGRVRPVRGPRMAPRARARPVTALRAPVLHGLGRRARRTELRVRARRVLLDLAMAPRSPDLPGPGRHGRDSRRPRGPHPRANRCSTRWSAWAP